MTVGVQILRAGVIGICVLPALRAFDRAIPIAIPPVPIIPTWRSGNLILGAFGIALNRNALVALYASAPLRSGNFRGAFPHVDNGFIVGIDHDAVAAFTHLGMNGNVRRLDFNVRFIIFVDFVIRQALADLKLHLRTRQAHHICIGLIRQAQDVCVVQLNFRASVLSRRNMVAADHRRIHRCRRPVARTGVLR